MVHKQFAGELAEGQRVSAAFVLRSREMRAARTGEAYLTLELADRSGRIPAVLFRPDATACAVPTGAVANVTGTVTTFRGVRRISVDALRPAKSWERDDMIASSTRPRRELVGALRDVVRAVKEPQLRHLLGVVFGDKEFFARFAECPATTGRHHAHLGGLLEHTVAVAEQCRALAASYDGVDADLLVTCALLHDLGVVDELVYDTAIDLTDQGRLIGHVVLGAQRIHRACCDCGLDPAVAASLEHAALAHHGAPEGGSPSQPSTVEALLLHRVDQLDADATGFIEALRGASVVGESWTDEFNQFQRPLYARRTASEAVSPQRSAPPSSRVRLSA